MKEEKIKSIEYSSKFLKSLSKLPNGIIKKAEEKEKIFKENPFDPRLRTHKLKGKEKETRAFWINYVYRIKFIFLSDKEVLFIDVGTHEIYK